jgi:hypothetical protein
MRNTLPPLPSAIVYVLLYCICTAEYSSFQKLADKLYSPGKGIIAWKLLSGSNIMRILLQKASAHACFGKTKYYANYHEISRKTFRVLEEKNWETLYRSYIQNSSMKVRTLTLKRRVRKETANMLHSEVFQNGHILSSQVL